MKKNADVVLSLESLGDENRASNRRAELGRASEALARARVSAIAPAVPYPA